MHSVENVTIFKIHRPCAGQCKRTTANVALHTACCAHVVYTAPSTVWSLCGYVNISCSQASSGQVFSQVPQVVTKITKGKSLFMDQPQRVH